MSGMGLKITELGIVVPGQITRKFDGTDTTLIFNEDQLRELVSSAKLALKVFEAQLDDE